MIAITVDITYTKPQNKEKALDMVEKLASYRNFVASDFPNLTRPNAIEHSDLEKRIPSCDVDKAEAFQELKDICTELEGLMEQWLAAHWIRVKQDMKVVSEGELGDPDETVAGEEKGKVKGDSGALSSLSIKNDDDE